LDLGLEPAMPHHHLTPQPTYRNKRLGGERGDGKGKEDERRREGGEKEGGEEVKGENNQVVSRKLLCRNVNERLEQRAQTSCIGDLG
jgi:hypothetical protein